MLPVRPRLRTLVLGLAVAASAAAAVPASTQAASNPSNPSNPLAGGTWGVYTGNSDGVYPAYQAATGTNKALLAKSALRPRVRWLGKWIPASKIGATIRDYIRTTQNGDPNVLVQMATFNLWPTGEGDRDKPLTWAQRVNYRTWTDNAAAAIGNARVVIVLEPDLGLTAPPNRAGAEKTADPVVRQRLVKYAAQKFGSLPRTSVYLDSSDADWLPIDKSVTLLKNTGIQYVRGFALGATHYSSVGGNLDYGTQLVAALGKAGVPGKHFVLDTADNGRPFTWLQFQKLHPNGDFDNAPTCRYVSSLHCVTLGYFPTANVASTRFTMSAAHRAEAAAHADGYLWFGRPWLVRQASPFSLTRTLQIGRTTRF